MKKLFILFSVFLVFLSLSLPCFAADSYEEPPGAYDEGLYTYYIKPGNYVLDSVIEFQGSFELMFTFTARNNVTYTAMIYDPATDGLNFVYTDADDPLSSDNRSAVYNTREDTWNNENYRYITVDEGFNIIDINQYMWWMTYVSPVSDEYNAGLVQNILFAFSSIGIWLGSAFNTLQSVFWVDGSLTLIGTLSVLGLAFAVIFLLFNMLRSFLKFR